MYVKYDIFQSLPAGPLWVEAVPNLQQAKKRLIALSRAPNQNQYLIFDSRVGRFIEPSRKLA